MNLPDQLKKGIFILLKLLAAGFYAQPPTASFTTSVIKCSGQSIIFTDQSGNAPTAWSWSFPGGSPSSSNVQNPTVSYTAAGIYTVTLLASASNFTGAPVSQTITIAPSPTVSFTHPGVQTLCSWESATLSAAGANIYTWFPGALTGATVLVSPPVSAAYTLVATTGSCNTPASTSLTLAPTFTILSFPTTITACTTDYAITIGFQSPSAISFSWSNGNTVPSFTVLPLFNQSYTCCVKGINTCKIDTYDLIVVPTPTIVINPAVICAGASTMLSASGALVYSWTPSTGINSPGIACVTANPLVSTIYTVTGKSGSILCSNSATVNISVDACLGIPMLTAVENFEIFPNPNAGSFSIKLETNTAKSVLEVYNANGEKIFSGRLTSEVNELSFKISSGIYYARIINSDNSPTVKKIVIR
ncbi:MAG: T9SS type A sorting domain-containing protein [Bacteroidota bacterium]